MNSTPTTSRWHRVPNAVTERIAEIGVIAYAIYGVLCRHADTKGRCWPSVARIAAMVGVSGRSVRRYLRVLVDADLIVIEPRKAGTACLANVYQLTIPQSSPDTSGRASLTPVAIEGDTKKGDSENKKRSFDSFLPEDFDTPKIRETLAEWFDHVERRGKQDIDPAATAVRACQLFQTPEQMVENLNLALLNGWITIRPYATGNGANGHTTSNKPEPKIRMFAGAPR